jgi:hypothetical protein
MLDSIRRANPAEPQVNTLIYFQNVGLPHPIGRAETLDTLVDVAAALLSVVSPSFQDKACTEQYLLLTIRHRRLGQSSPWTLPKAVDGDLGSPTSPLWKVGFLTTL